MDQTRFKRCLKDPTFKPTSVGNSPGHDRTQVKRLILCTGQLYYDLVAGRKEAQLDRHVMILRVEQLSPFPIDNIADEIMSLPNLESIVWAQEEPMNQGPWGYCRPRIRAILDHCGRPNGINKVIFCGRDVSASPACGDPHTHANEQNQIVKDAMNLSRKHNSYYEKYLSGSVI